ncbi:PH domain-containing protein [Brachybacterium sp. GCM10030267]|uniref:PH domain-containing protein n=1 Tax=unclassified Brachybacterium TaxID=2623841 RepID=UPI00361AC31D
MDPREPEHPIGREPATVVIRPRMVRIAGYITGVVVLGGTVAGAVVIPGLLLGGRLGLVAVGVLILLFCHLEASVRLIAGPDSLEVRNVFRARTLDWAEILAIRFPVGDPWAHLDLADGTTLALNAIQRYDGERGIAAARRLRDLVRERGEAPDVG